jgi:hypothetical protein
LVSQGCPGAKVSGEIVEAAVRFNARGPFSAGESTLIMKLHRLPYLFALAVALSFTACTTDETVTTTTVTEERTVQPGVTTETHVQRTY